MGGARKVLIAPWLFKAILMELFLAPLKQESFGYATEANTNAGIHRSKCQETSASLYTFWTVIQVIFYVYLFSFGRIILVSRPGMDRTIPQERCFWLEY